MVKNMINFYLLTYLKYYFNLEVHKFLLEFRNYNCLITLNKCLFSIFIFFQKSIEKFLSYLKYIL